MTAIAVSPTRTISGATGGKGLGDKGPIVVLVPGAAMDRSVWALQTRWLAHHGCPAVAIDLPGHGASSEAERETIEAYADWTAELVTDIGRPVHLVGHSMGSFVALECANRVELASLTLVGTAAAMPVHPALLEAAAANDPLASQLMSGWAFATGVRTGAHPSPGGSMVGGTQAMIAQAKPGVLHRDLAMCAAYESATETAAHVETPTTLLLGQLDKMTPVRAAQPVIDALQTVHTEVVPGVGHMVMIEAPEITRSIIASSVTGGHD